MQNYDLFKTLANAMRPEAPAPKPAITQKTVDRYKAWEETINSAVAKMNEMRLEYHIEEARVTGETVEVKYCPKGEEREADPIFYDDDIDIDRLREFVEDRGLNDFCNDCANHLGEHVQETGTVPFEYFIEDKEALKFAFAEYLRLGGETI